MAGVLERFRGGALRHVTMWPEERRAAEAGRPVRTESWAPPKVRASVSTSTALIPASTFTFSPTLYDRSTAIRLPTLARARNIHVNVVSVLPLRYWQRNPDPAVDDRQIPLLEWMFRPDPNNTPAYTLGWTTDDLFWHERAYWRVRERFPGSGFPRSFEWMPFVECDARYSSDLTALQYVQWRGQRINMEDVVEFRGLNAGVLCVGSDAITTALKLERAAQRFADFNLPAGTINIPLAAGDEPHTIEELNEIGDNFDTRRSSSSTAVLEGASYANPDWDAEKMGLIPNRAQSALDLSRLGSVPPWMVGAPAPDGMTYSNAGWSRRDLVDFGSAGFMTTIVQTLSGPNVIPPGTYLDFDLEGWIALANDLGAVVPAKPVQP